MTIEIICPHCNLSRTIPREKIPPGARWATCSRCKHRFELVVPRGGTGFEEIEKETGPEMKTGRSPSPWESRSELGMGKAITLTLKAVLFSPIGFFRGAATEGGMREPLAFGLLLGSAGMMLEVFWQFLMMSESLTSIGGGLFGPITMGLIFLAAMIFCPLFVALIIFTASVIVHISLLIVRGGSSGFEATFRVICFSQATQVWGVIPLVGGLIGGIWILVVQIIGLREIHEISYLKVIIALLIPLALIFLLFVAVLIPLVIIV
ncbi:MAG: YIP1 family protein [Desulfobacteraceae bacterium]|jgi:hypothetical protein